jgi:sec-independent protein translocase protein TatA
MGSIGIPELLIVLFVVLLILGPKRLPGLGRSLGGGLREFRDSIRSKESPPAGIQPAEDRNGPFQGADEVRDPITGEVVPESRR